jgi:peptidoglycan/LPS O-acetylase OafA/YrhL
MTTSYIKISAATNEDSPTQRYALLDGLRGIAALCVVVYHYGLFKNLSWLNGAWASVDLFFLLSGFVIAHAYENKILQGMGQVSFYLARLIRLYPMYLIGLTLGLLAAVVSSTSPVHAEKMTNAWLLGMFWIPTWKTDIWPVGTHSIVGPSFPLNVPSWSLFFELCANAVFYFYVRMRKPKLVFVVFLLLLPAYISISLLIPGVFNQGHSVDGFLFGFPRVMFGFFGGVFIYTYRRHLMSWLQRFIGPSLNVHLTLTLMCLSLLLILFTVGGGKSAFINSITIAPATVFLMSWLQPDTTKPLGRSLAHGCETLGTLSYPVYVLHMPLLMMTYIFLTLTTKMQYW